MLQAIRAVDADATIDCTRKNDWRGLRELDDSLWRVQILLLSSLVILGELWCEGVLLEVPNLNTTVIGNGSED